MGARRVERLRRRRRTDPRLADGDGDGGGITVELGEPEIVEGGVTVELGEPEIVDGGITVELGEVEIVDDPDASEDALPPGEGPESACAAMQELIWECGESGWKRGDCQGLDLLVRCGIDVTVTNPTDDGWACPADASASDDPTVVLVAGDAAGRAVRHVPGADRAWSRARGLGYAATVIRLFAA